MKFAYACRIALLVCLVATGCAGIRTPLKEQDRTALRTVCVDRQVAMPDAAAYYGHLDGAGGIFFGLAGNMTGRVLEEPDRIALNTLLVEHRVDVAAMLRDGFKARLAESAVFAQVQDDACEATFRIAVEKYGLIARNFSPPIPMVWARTTLVRTDGRVLWDILVKQPEEFKFENPAPPMTVDEYRKQPEALRQAFADVLDIVVGKSVAGLHR